MNTNLKTQIIDFIRDVEELNELYRIMSDCINYHTSCVTNGANVLPLAKIIEQKFVTLAKTSDKIFFELKNLSI